MTSIYTNGNQTSCALLTSGGADCWGYGANGELGDGSTANSDVPEAVAGLNGVANLTTDVVGNTFCAQLNSGGVDCWGFGVGGQLGDGQFASSDVPVAVGGLNGVASLDTNFETFCALLTSGGVDCWGTGAHGQLGDGSATDSAVPVAVSGLRGVAALSSNLYDGTFCALLTSGGVDCWGNGGNGELGNGQTADSDVPVAVSGLNGVASLYSDGNDVFCALLTSGGVDCWGFGTDGELGNGFTVNSDVPVVVSGIADVANLKTDSNGTFCALLSTGGVDCWGFGTYGQLGDGQFANSDVPAPVSGLGGVAGLYSSPNGATLCAVLTNGAVDCWGIGNNGQLGDASTINSDVPVAVVGIGP